MYVTRGERTCGVPQPPITLQGLTPIEIPSVSANHQRGTVTVRVRVALEVIKHGSKMGKRQGANQSH